MQHRFVSHTSKFHVADLSVQRSSNLNQLLDSTVLRLHGFLPVVLFTWNNKVLLRSWSICIYLHMLLLSPCRKNYLPLRLLSGKVCIQLAKVRPWTFQSPSPPPLYILHAYLPPQMSCRLLEGGRIILSSNLSSMSGVWSWSKTWTIFAICTTVSSRVPIHSQSPQHLQFMREWKCS